MSKDRDLHDKLSVETKLRIAQLVLQDSMTTYKRPALLLTPAEASVLAGFQVKQLMGTAGMRMIPSVLIQHGQHFPESIRFLSSLSRDWECQMIEAEDNRLLMNWSKPDVKLCDLDNTHREFLAAAGISQNGLAQLDTHSRWKLLKTLLLRKKVQESRLDCIIVGDERESVVSGCSARFVGLNHSLGCVVTRPFSTMSESEIWKVAGDDGLPVHPLYYQGFQYIDGLHDSIRGTSPPWVESPVSDRVGDNQDEDRVEERLRRLGYM